MNTLTRLAAIAVLGGIVTGCASLRGPNWLHPGPAAYQQKQAERFDPYPDPDIGPEVVGSRPREYQKPRPEPERARWTLPLFAR
ncbi:MAG: membrane or secreted protein [Thermoguttaceae bacterium]|nr:membrane or secreted protein [Thermoguttaceae bacterium]